MLRRGTFCYGAQGSFLRAPPAPRDNDADRVNDDPHLLRPELHELVDEARSYLDGTTDDELAGMVRALRVSSLVDVSRPDRLDLHLARVVAKMPRAWSDASVLAGVAFASAEFAGEALDDEAFALRYLGAARDALRLAEMLGAPATHRVEQVQAAAAAKRDRHADELVQFAAAWRAQPQGEKYDAKVEGLGRHFKRGRTTVERWVTEARRAGLID